MSTDLDDRLRGLFTELAEATPVQTPSRFQPERIAHADRAPDRPRRTKRLVLVGVAAAAVVIVGLVVTRLGDDSAKVSTAAIPSTDPVLWVPDTSSGAVTITGYPQIDAGPRDSGAVRAPDGTVFNFVLDLESGGPLRPNRPERVIGGHTVRVAVGGETNSLPPDVVLRNIALGCSNLDVMTVSEEPWSSDSVALLEGVAFADGIVRIELPSGWTSLGEAPSRQQFGLIFDVAVDAGKQTLSLTQMPGAQVGFYLSGLVTTPHPVDVGGRQGWTVEDDPMHPGYATLVAERDGTAFLITGAVPVSQLIEIAEGMVRAPQADWISHNNPSQNGVVLPTAPPGCQLAALEILSNP